MNGGNNCCMSWTSIRAVKLSSINTCGSEIPNYTSMWPTLGKHLIAFVNPLPRPLLIKRQLEHAHSHDQSVSGKTNLVKEVQQIGIDF